MCSAVASCAFCIFDAFMCFLMRDPFMLSILVFVFVLSVNAYIVKDFGYLLHACVFILNGHIMHFEWDVVRAELSYYIFT